MAKHFLTLHDLDSAQLRTLIDRAIEMKAMWRESGTGSQIMRNRTLALVFEKSSTRTRVSFEVAANQLGGSSMFVSPSDSQIRRGETMADTARVLSSMVDAIVVRTSAHSTVEDFAANSSVPVINGLSDAYHPCQLLADMQTWMELRGAISGIKAAWLGDGNNVCHSWANAADLFGFKLTISTPAQFRPDPQVLSKVQNSVETQDDPRKAVEGADLVVTDTWASMGQEDERGTRQTALEPYRVTQELMRRAKPEALFMHCLPAYRGMEVDAAVIDGPQSAVWQEAENRLHAQKALLELLLASD